MRDHECRCTGWGMAVMVVAVHLLYTFLKEDCTPCVHIDIAVGRIFGVILRPKRADPYGTI